MNTVAGVGNVTEAVPSRPLRSRDRSPSVPTAQPQDALQISSLGQQAAEVVRITSKAIENSEIRDQQVEQAKQNVREGSHKVQEVVLRVASRVAQLL